MGNPFKTGDTPQELGRISENRTCKRLHGKQTPGSGALDGAKSDMVVGGFRIESKATTNKSMSLKYDWLKKISQEAAQCGQVPALTVQFVAADGRPVTSGSYVMIPEWVFRELLGELG